MRCPTGTSEVNDVRIGRADEWERLAVSRMPIAVPAPVYELQSLGPARGTQRQGCVVCTHCSIQQSGYLADNALGREPADIDC